MRGSGNSVVQEMDGFKRTFNGFANCNYRKLNGDRKCVMTQTSLNGFNTLNNSCAFMLMVQTEYWKGGGLHWTAVHLNKSNNSSRSFGSMESTKFQFFFIMEL